MAHARHSWESDSDVEPSPPDEPMGAESSAEAELGPSPTDEFIALMANLVISREVSAKVFCTAMFWASKAGIPAAAKYGYKPDAPSGHYNRHLRKVLGCYSKENYAKLYHLLVPSTSTEGLGRDAHSLAALPPHEVVAEDAVADRAMLAELDSLVRARALPPRYFDSRVVRDSPAGSPPAIPLALFVDGVPYSHVDSVVGFWVINQVSGKRFLVAAFKKKLACQCGCTGWCSYHALMSFLSWSLLCLARGQHPQTRHDGAHFQDREAWRAATASAPMARRAVVTCVKGDWSEYATTMGFPSWNDSVRPCFLCNAPGANFYEFAGLSLDWAPWQDNGPGDYTAACARCEMTRTNTEASHSALIGVLAYDKRSSSGCSRGLALKVDVPALDLKQGDRVEPTARLLDVAGVFALASFPTTLTLGRPSRETLARHRSPLLCDELGLSPHDSLTVDPLHALFLGVMTDYCRHVIWRFLTIGVWGRVGAMEEQIKIAIIGLRHDLHGFYRRWRQERPHEPLTHVANMSAKTVGTSSDRQLRTKGAETWGVLLWLIDFLSEPNNSNRVGPDAGWLLEAAAMLERIVRTMQRNGVVVPTTDVEAMVAAWKRFAALTAGCADLRTPKRHAVAHMLLKTPILGNPRAYANWLGESLTKLLKAACRGISQATFESSLLLRMPELLESRKRPRAAP